MKVRMSRGRALATAAIVVGGTLAVAVPAEAAVQLQSQSPPESAKISPTATLKANGAGVVVNFTVRCPRGATVSIGYTLTETIGAKTTRADGYFYPADCTGSPESMKISALAGPKSLQPGKAFVTADVYFSNAGSPLYAQRVVTLAK